LIWGLPVRVAIDCGLSRHVGVLWFQVRPSSATVTRWQGDRVTNPVPGHLVTPSPCHVVMSLISVFADESAVDKTSEFHIQAILARSQVVCQGRLEAVDPDPAATACVGRCGRSRPRGGSSRPSSAPLRPGGSLE
jgi:hypothetical protein